MNFKSTIAKCGITSCGRMTDQEFDEHGRPFSWSLCNRCFWLSSAAPWCGCRAQSSKMEPVIVRDEHAGYVCPMHLGPDPLPAIAWVSTPGTGYMPKDASVDRRYARAA